MQPNTTNSLSLRLLIADDDADDLALFSSLFREESPAAIVTTMLTGLKVIEFLENCPMEDLPHALILDYNMPFMTGAEILDWLCARPRYHGISKFMLSTASQQQYRDNCMNKGALEYFSKPSSVEGLQIIVREIIVYLERIVGAQQMRPKIDRDV